MGMGRDIGGVRVKVKRMKRWRRCRFLHAAHKLPTKDVHELEHKDERTENGE